MWVCYFGFKILFKHLTDQLKKVKQKKYVMRIWYMIKQNMIKLSSREITKKSGPQFALLSLLCKFCLLVALNQYLLNTNDICL